jgi:hypothetical protein
MHLGSGVELILYDTDTGPFALSKLENAVATLMEYGPQLLLRSRSKINVIIFKARKLDFSVY